MFKNKTEFDLLDLLTIYGKDNVFPISNELKISGVSIDSRNIEPGNLFIAIKGENFDGHNFVEEAYSKDAVCCIVNKKYYDEHTDFFKNKSYVLVKDSLIALHKIAKLHRNRFSIPIIAIAGSNGKTTTKDMLSAILSQNNNILSTIKNFNNQIGVPLMLLSLTKEHQYAVLEIGTNMPGEIYVLSNLVAPTHGLITNIGKEHLEQLIDLDGVEQEETFLFGYLRNRGYSLLNIDDQRLKKYKPILEKTLTYGTTDEAMVKGNITLDAELKPRIQISQGDDTQFEFQLQTFGYGSGLAALAASATALLLDIPIKEIISGLENFKPAHTSGYGRMLLEKLNNITIINDCYNSNPASAELAIKSLNSYKSNGKKIAVLGDMLELGEDSLAEHINILNLAMELPIQLYLYGNIMKKAMDKVNNNNILHFDTHSQITEQLLSTVINEDILLFKGSRGMKLENIVNEFKKQILNK